MDRADDSTKGEDRAQPAKRARLTLRPVGMPRRDRLHVTLDITNTGQTTFKWDKEFCAFVEWTIAGPDGSSLTAIPVTNATGDAEPRARSDRFVELAPGESLSKELHLAESVCAYWHARRSVADPEGGSVVLPTAGEDVVRYEIPDATESVRISVAYDGDNPDAADGFAVYFGFRPEEKNVLMQHLETDEVIIRFSQ